jgi:SAM-dependent methyltransferase
MSNYTILRCLCCDSETLESVLDLGQQPPANSYSVDAGVVVPPHPLGLNRCTQCWHSQLSFCVDRQEIFDRYAYVSGTSRTLTQFFTWFARALASIVPPEGRVLELAANDGSLIREMQKQGLECIGVDPARNIVETARSQGLPVHCGYWPEAAQDVQGEFDAIVCMNVVAHVDDPMSFLAGCAAKLRRGGVVIVQPSQARMFENGEFDTIYHEHISFFNSRSMDRLARRVGLKLAGTALFKVHGDSPVYFLRHADLPDDVPSLDAFRQGEFGIDEDLLAYERKIGLFERTTYDRFRASALHVIHDLRGTVETHRARDFEIVFVGAAAKAMTVLNAAGIRPDRLLDESPLKVGLYAPGCGQRVEGLDVVRGLARPALFVLSAWNFRLELAQKLRDRGVPEGSVFYAYFPQSHWL